MKKFLSLASLFILLPATAACPIDGDGTACTANLEPALTMPELSRTAQPNFMPTPPAKPNAVTKDYSAEKPLRDFGQTKEDFSYNASCQFGVCSQTGTPQLFQQRGE